MLEEQTGKMSQVKLQDGRFSTEDKINHLAELAFVLCPDCTEKFRLIVKREQNIKEEAGRQPAPSANAVDDSDNRHTQPIKAGSECYNVR